MSSTFFTIHRHCIKYYSEHHTSYYYKTHFHTKLLGLTLKSFPLRPISCKRIHELYKSIQLERSAAVINDNVVGMFRKILLPTTRYAVLHT